MSNQALTEILAAVANGEGAADEVLTTVSLGALRALVRQEPIGYMQRGAVDLLRGDMGRQLVWGINTFVYVKPNDGATAVYDSPAPVVAGQAVPNGVCSDCAKIVGQELAKRCAAAKKQGGA